MTSCLHEERLEAVHDVVRRCGARSVIDLGCGDGDLLVRLAEDPRFERLAGVDHSLEALAQVRARLGPRAGEGVGTHVALVHGSMTDAGLVPAGFECAVLLETIEHIEPGRLSQLERSVFRVMRPATVVITTPNADFNPLLGVPAGRFRHPDHRFEWGRAKFHAWAHGVARRNDYEVRLADLGGTVGHHGAPSQLAIFRALGSAPPGG